MKTFKIRCQCWFVFPPLTLEEGEGIPDLYCPGCRGGARIAQVQLMEPQDVSGTIESDISPHDREVFQRFLSRVDNQDRATFIRAEVEAMDWPEVIGE